MKNKNGEKKSFFTLAFQVPRKECRPVKKTKKQPRCRQVPKQDCRPTTRQECQEIPREQCREVPKQQCQQIPKQKCQTVPRQQCQKVPRQECQTAPRQSCQQVPKQNCQQVGGNTSIGQRMPRNCFFTLSLSFQRCQNRVANKCLNRTVSPCQSKSRGRVVGASQDNPVNQCHDKNARR